MPGPENDNKPPKEKKLRERLAAGLASLIKPKKKSLDVAKKEHPQTATKNNEEGSLHKIRKALPRVQVKETVDNSEMSKMTIGDYFIRPSSMGGEWVTLVIKINKSQNGYEQFRCKPNFNKNNKLVAFDVDQTIKDVDAKIATIQLPLERFVNERILETYQHISVHNLNQLDDKNKEAIAKALYERGKELVQTTKIEFNEKTERKLNTGIHMLNTAYELKPNDAYKKQLDSAGKKLEKLISKLAKEQKDVPSSRGKVINTSNIGNHNLRTNNKEIVLNPSYDNLNPEQKQALLDLLNHANNHGIHKITKSRGLKAFGVNRNKPGTIVNDVTIHLDNASLIRFPPNDKFYVVGRTLGEGNFGKVKLLGKYFQVKDGRLTEGKDDKDNVMKVIKEKTDLKGQDLSDEMTRELTGAKEVGGMNEASAFIRKNLHNEERAHVLLKKASGVDLEKYMQTHLDITVEERVKIITQLIEKLEELHRMKPPRYYTDLKPENIFYDGKIITFVDLASVAKKNDTDYVYTPDFYPSNQQGLVPADKVEAYALSGVIGVVLSKYSSSNSKYDGLPFIKTKNNQYEFERLSVNHDPKEIEAIRKIGGVVKNFKPLEVSEQAYSQLRDSINETRLPEQLLEIRKALPEIKHKVKKIENLSEAIKKLKLGDYFIRPSSVEGWVTLSIRIPSAPGIYGVADFRCKPNIVDGKLTSFTVHPNSQYIISETLPEIKEISIPLSNFVNKVVAAIYQDTVKEAPSILKLNDEEKVVISNVLYERGKELVKNAKVDTREGMQNLIQGMSMIESSIELNRNEASKAILADATSKIDEHINRVRNRRESPISTGPSSVKVVYDRLPQVPFEKGTYDKVISAGADASKVKFVDRNSAEAELKQATVKAGEYIIRPSSQENKIAVSYKKDNQVAHALFEMKNGVLIQEGDDPKSLNRFLADIMALSNIRYSHSPQNLPPAPPPVVNPKIVDRVTAPPPPLIANAQQRGRGNIIYSKLPGPLELKGGASPSAIREAESKAVTNHVKEMHDKRQREKETPPQAPGKAPFSKK